MLLESVHVLLVNIEVDSDRLLVKAVTPLYLSCSNIRLGFFQSESSCRHSIIDSTEGVVDKSVQLAFLPTTYIYI